MSQIVDETGAKQQSVGLLLGYSTWNVCDDGAPHEIIDRPTYHSLRIVDANST